MAKIVFDAIFDVELNIVVIKLIIRGGLKLEKS